MRIGTFIKTPSPHVAELLGLAGFDFGVIDVEHGPFDRGSADLMTMAGRAAGLPLLLRVPAIDASAFLWALDIGSAGLVVPRVETPERALDAVRKARCRGGERGFSNSGRYARYGTTSFAEALDLGEQASIFCQIESGEAVAHADAIAATDGVTGLVIGRADLALSLGETRGDAPAVLEGTRRALGAAADAGKQAVIVTSGAAEAPAFIAMGATMVIVGSDQSFLRTAAAQAVAQVGAHLSGHGGSTAS
jgi:2-keto-3-deoxy-L-rhamnonate aldolase RhmA